MRLRALLSLVCAAPLFGSAYFLHYTSSGPAPEKFDVAALPQKTITFFVSDDGPSAYAPHDSFLSVLAQVRQAAAAWNAAPSDLRVAFGGQSTAGTPRNGVAAQVVFEDLPPGVYGYSGPVSTANLNTAGASPFFPITLSTVHLARDLTQLPGPSFSEGFYLVTVHEMGHALGLQHSFTSSVMSTVATRATSLRQPIAPDDIAGLAHLYPTSSWTAATGTLRGQILFQGGAAGVHMASVVAIRGGAPALSTLTLPDGTFQIDGVPAGQYFVYAHALPPTADMVNPKDQDGNDVPPSGPFATLIYPGTRSFLQGSPVSVAAGKITDGIDLSVAAKASVDIYGVSVYSYFGGNAVHPAQFNATQSQGTVVAAGAGIAANGNAAAGLGVEIIGGSVGVSAVRPYVANGSTYLALDLRPNPLAAAGPQHLVFTTPTELYVLPSALSLVSADPPTIASMNVQGNGSVALTAAGLSQNSQIYFDGLPASAASIDVPDGTATVTPPAGGTGQSAAVAIYNADGQNSAAAQPGAVPIYSYPDSAAATAGLQPATLPAGSEASVEITGVNTHFAAGETTVGFGGSDAFVRELFVLSPTHLLVNVSVPGTAALSTAEVTVMTGFERVLLPLAFSIAPQLPRKPAVYPRLFNAVAGQLGAFPGAIVTLYGSNMQADGSTAFVTLNGQPAPLLYTSAGQINLVVPNLPPGPALLVVQSGTDSSYPVVIRIDPPEPFITAVSLAGRDVTLTLTGFPAGSGVIAPSRLSISVGGISLPPVLAVTAGGLTRVAFTLTDAVPAGPQPLIVYVDGRSSTQATLNP